MKNIKHIETRSQRTSYRGELYIHTSDKKLAKEYLNARVLELISNLPMNFGNIICKGNLVGCILMDEKFLEQIKKDEIKYFCSSYELGRYAWVFEDIKQIKTIKAKGHLNIWNYNDD